MNFAFFIVIISSAISLLPSFFVIVYWKKKGFSFDTRANIIGLYLIITAVITVIQFYLANHFVNNIFLLRLFIPIEVFLLSLFLLSFRIRLKTIIIMLSFSLALLTFITDKILGTLQTDPIEELLMSSTILIWLTIFSVRKIDSGKKGKNSYTYFLLAISFGAIINYSAILWEALPQLVLTTMSITNIICYTLYSVGFYILIKE